MYPSIVRERDKITLIKALSTAFAVDYCSAYIALKTTKNPGNPTIVES